MIRSGGIAAALALGLCAGGAKADTADPQRGAEVFALCSGCHTVGAEADNGVGPHLNGIFGRRAAGIEGFAYSASMQRAGAEGLTWSYETLEAYLENPRALVSGTRMSFDGLDDAQEVADVMAYLRAYSDSPADLPGAAPTLREVDLPVHVLAIEGDTEYGAYLSSECVACHQADGSDSGIPSIVFWPEEDFVVALHAYRRKLRPHPAMQMIAGRLSDEEIAALAAYFATGGN
jgi:cytochrome c